MIGRMFGRVREGVGLFLMKKNVRVVWSRVQLGVEKCVFLSTYSPGTKKGDKEK